MSEEVKDEKKFNIVYQNDDVVIAFRVRMKKNENRRDS